MTHNIEEYFKQDAKKKTIEENFIKLLKIKNQKKIISLATLKFKT